MTPGVVVMQRGAFCTHGTYALCLSCPHSTSLLCEGRRGGCPKHARYLPRWAFVAAARQCIFPRLQKRLVIAAALRLLPDLCCCRQQGPMCPVDGLAALPGWIRTLRKCRACVLTTYLCGQLLTWFVGPSRTLPLASGIVLVCRIGA